MSVKKYFFFLLTLLSFQTTNTAQHSVARLWNEALLEAIRNDFARPTVHARNLFHTSIAMYDAWAVYDEVADTYFLGKDIGGFIAPFENIANIEMTQANKEEAISYAAYRLLRHRFQNAPSVEESYLIFDSLFEELGYDVTYTATDYQSGNAADMGNYIAQELIRFGLQDGSNEANDYANLYYRAINFGFSPEFSGNGIFRFPNNWQPITFDIFIDQSGNPLPVSTPPFLSPEWGNVIPFALTDDDLTTYNRSGNDYKVFHDPGAPYLLDVNNPFSADSEAYKWGFELVSIWGAHLDPADEVIWDISPATIGNIDEFPTTPEEYEQFYNRLDGGDASMGHAVNPHTGQPYAPQLVPRADYARVLAEFWADGPDSETPPGHWFTILNYVNDHPLFEKRWQGRGEELSDLEWDVKAYFTLGGAVHDAAIAAWSVKGWYDYVRPISAIRYLSGQGQSSDPADLSYNPNGIRLVEGFIELVREGDALAGRNSENVGKIKLYTWRGPTFIEDPETDIAGVGWILGENWWPYQRPTFVTPPFAGYVSGHSTYSRAAADILTAITGDEFFPGGMGVFDIKQNEFLVFEEGPSVDLTLQWATYRDASDQTSLSRIWGGIHPPIDDIPGRIIGEKVAIAAFEKANAFLSSNNTVSSTDVIITEVAKYQIAPNPLKNGHTLQIKPTTFDNSPVNIQLLDATGNQITEWSNLSLSNTTNLLLPNVSTGIYFLKIQGNDGIDLKKLVVR